MHLIQHHLDRDAGNEGREELGHPGQHGGEIPLGVGDGDAGLEPRDSAEREGGGRRVDRVELQRESRPACPRRGSETEPA